MSDNYSFKDKENTDKFIELIKWFRSIKPSFTPEQCPFNIDVDLLNDGYFLTHYDLSQAAVGTGLIRWECPFCGEHFEE